jgi:hypothetical protein
MSAAVAATKFEKPALSASLTANVGNPAGTAPIGIVMLPTKEPPDGD